MDSLEILLQKIREVPGLWLDRKSLTLLNHFLNGYAYGVHSRVTIETDLAQCNFTSDFNKFVHSYYNHEMGAMSAEWLISKMCNSEEEAFDKYFELRDTFLKQKSDSDDPTHNG